MAVDDGPGGGVQHHPERRERAVELGHVIGRQVGEGLDARRERNSLAVQACLLAR